MMKTVIIKKKPKNRNQDPNNNPNKDKDSQGNVVQSGAESFAQQGKEIRCICCGKEGELSSDCPLKNKIASKDWYNKTGIEHWKTTKVNTQVCQEASGEGKVTKVGFVGMQVATPASVEPEILLDSGSTISLFKDSTFLKDVWQAQSRLVMETNARRKIISEKGHVDRFGEVWFDKHAISNIFSLSDVVKKGFRVVYDSEIGDEFIVHLRDKRTISFPLKGVSTLRKRTSK